MGIQIKKFQGQTLQQAIEQVRSELGDNAIILQTETIKMSGPMGLPKNGVEVTAAIDRKEAPRTFHAIVVETAEERTTQPEKTSGWRTLFKKNKTTAKKT